MGNKKLFLVRNGDFIVSVTFGWEGAVALARSSEDGMYCSIRFPTFIVNREICNPEYLLNFFKTPKGVKLLNDVSPGSAGRNRVLNIRRLLQKEIPVPEIKEQNYAVSKINKLEKVESIRHSLIDDINLLKESCFEEELEKIEKSSVVSLNDVLSRVKRRITPEASKLYKRVGIRLEGRGLFLREEKEGSIVKANHLFLVKEGDFVYSRLFAWRGSFAFVGKEFDGCFVSNEFPTFKMDNKRIDPRFLLLYLCRKKTLDHIETLCAGTTKISRNRLKEDKFLGVRIKISSLERQKEIVSWINKIHSYLMLQHGFLGFLERMKMSIIDNSCKQS